MGSDTICTGGSDSGKSDLPCDTRSLASSAPLFALIIGINEYTNWPNLHGAVSDANAVKDYLEEVLRVPEERIHTLFDQEATRDAIVKAFKDLGTDERISEGDPILIYYSGHGGELPAPRVWGIQSKIQCVVSCNTEDSPTAPANARPIPDYTIGTLIMDIAKSKGNNITVIFDCCHSASGTRDQSGQYVPRAVVLRHNIPDDLDVDIWGGRRGDIPPDLAFHSLSSHVLLAACGKNESAYEHEGHGLFTTALLSTLKNSTINDLSYADLLKRIRTRINTLIRLFWQNPHCEGTNRKRILFDGKVFACRQGYSVHALRGNKYAISAGLAHGVAYGVELTLYNDQQQRHTAIVVDDTAVIDNFQTTVVLHVHVPDDAFAKLTRVGNLPIYLSAAGNHDLSSLLVEIQRGTGVDSTLTSNFQLVENVEEAKLEVVVDSQLVTFNILDRRVNGLGLTRLPRSVTLDHVAHVLNTAARYYWYLDLTNKNSRIETKNQVTVEFYRLESDYDDYGYIFYTPIEPGLCKKDPNSDNLDVIEFVVDPDDVYGIKITNNSPWDLYLNAFLFNNHSLSIQPYYTQQNNREKKAPLKHNGVFTIGYGPGVTDRFRYSLEEGEDVEIGYLKIFFATQPIDLSGLVQPSPFTTSADGRDLAECIKHMENLKMGLSKQAEKSVGAWFTVEIPVVQRRQ